MRILRKVIRFIFIALAIPVLYALASLLLSLITINTTKTTDGDTEIIYLSTNGVHLNVILAQKDMSEALLEGLVVNQTDEFYSIGWGDEEFYLNTPYWSDLTFKTAFQAVFLKGSSLMHVTRYRNVQKHWVSIELNKAELIRLNEIIAASFMTGEGGKKIHLVGKGYSYNDDFYQAVGSYSCFNTCNTWVNSVFKQSGLKCCMWTPFDFGLMNKYQ